MQAAAVLAEALDLREALYRLAQDLGSRQQVERGEARVPDYRDELEGIIVSRFKTRRAFCEATGLSEDMLSHVPRGNRSKSMLFDRATLVVEKLV